VVALSGLDGCGKSTQAAALCGTLQRLGYDAVVVRTRISWETWLWELVFSVKRLARAVAGGGARRPRSVAGVSGSAPDSGEDRGDDVLRHLRQRSASLTDLWAAVITLANAWSQWRLMGGAMRRGAIVVSDRYTLDSIVELRYAYGEHLPLAVCRRLLSWLYPRPARAYLLDVAPATALARKGEWGEPWLTRHRALYLQEAPKLGVTVLDGERPQADLCAEIARAVWTTDRQ
jgi:thymidylate kinase